MRGGGFETTETGGSGEREGKRVEMDRRDDLDDRDWIDGSADRERRRDHLYSVEYCSACQGNPFV